MSRPRVFCALALCMAWSRSASPRGADRADADAPRYECSALVAALRDALLDEETHHVQLRDPALVDRAESGEGERCDAFARAARALRGSRERDAERGRLADRPALLLRDGPHGSGRYWDLTLVADIDGRIVGTCMTTSTSGWRNLWPEGHQLFGRWRALTDGRVVIWSSLTAGTTEAENLIWPIVYRLAGGALLVDRAATRTEIGRFGRLYARVAASRADQRRALHQAAAAAFGAFASGSECTRR